MGSQWKCRRKIIEYTTFRTEWHPPNAHDSVIVKFECGHEKRYKWSNRPKAMKFGYCTECAIHSKKGDV